MRHPRGERKAHDTGAPRPAEPRLTWEGWLIAFVVVAACVNGIARLLALIEVL